MASVPVSFGSTGGGTGSNSAMGLYFQVAALPASDMMLLDLYGGASGYFRMKLTSAGAVVGEAHWGSHTRTLTISGSMPVTPGFWHWASWGGTDSEGNWQLSGQLYRQDGAAGGQQSTGFQSDPNFTATTTFNCQLGIGVSLSPIPAYLNFPNATGYRWSKVLGYRVTGNVVNYYGPPSSDPSSSGMDYLYLCRDSLGAQSTIVDSSSNAFTLSAGTNGLTIIAAGPYP